MAAKESREQSERDWWGGWRAADYSWTGLAKRRWEGWSITPDGALVERSSAPKGSRDATLQDYWRDEEDHLIVGDGKSWTRAHCPLVWADGTDTPKAKWSDTERAAFEVLIASKISQASETAFDGEVGEREVVGADRRAQLRGCIWLGPFVLAPPQSTSVSADFAHTYFLRDANFSSVKFVGDANFEDSFFGDFADFWDADFQGFANFHSATFVSVASFYRGRFSKHANFYGCTFFRTARFEGTSFLGDANFSFCLFSGDAWFSKAHDRRGGAEFAKGADFSNVAFDAAARFSESRFCSVLTFKAAHFSDYTDFSMVAAPASEVHWRGAFDGAVVEGALDWRGVPYHVLAALSGVTLTRGILLSKISEGAEAKQQALALKAARGASDKDAALVALEGGAAVLKLASEKISDKLRAQRFYRFELVARRKQQGTPRFEVLFSNLYAFAANYGASIGRPFFLLLLMIPACAFVYWAWESALAGRLFESLSALVATPHDPATWAPIWDALAFSSGRVLPFGPWADSTVFLANVDAHGAGWGFGFRFAATVQSLCAIALAFLFGLAVRRRFQIN